MKYKRLIMPLFIFCLILNMPMYALAKETAETKPATIRLEYDDQSVTKGNEVTVNVVVRDVTDLYGVQFEVKYDQSKLELKSASAKGNYNDFGGIKTDPGKGTILLPLLREGVSSSNTPLSVLTIAQLKFTAQSAGEASLTIQGLKAVSSKSFMNEHDLKDLAELAMIAGEALTIQIVNPSTIIFPEPSTGSPSVEQELKELEKRLASGNTEQALAQLKTLLSGGTAKFTELEMKKLQELAEELQRQLENSVLTTADSSAQANLFENNSLMKAVQALENLAALAAGNHLNLPASKGVHVQLSDNGYSALHITAEQAKLLDQHKMALVLERAQGSAIISSDVLLQDQSTVLHLSAVTTQAGEKTGKHYTFVSRLQLQVLKANGEAAAISQPAGKLHLSLYYDANRKEVHKLGVYMWNEQTSSWDYVRQAKRLDGKFELVANEPGMYAVMEYSVHFKDIGKVYQEAKHAIETLTAMHYMFGTSEDKFSPDKEITRAEFVALLVRILDLKPIGSEAGSFADVDAKAWYAGEVYAAKKAGIVQGDGSKFNPNGILTREAMAVMLVNAGLLNEEAAAAAKFADDAAISKWAKEAVYKAKASGLIKGVGKNTLQPQASAKRADAAVMLLRLIERQ
ncbi:S-layer homology domain-containing protein [Paenibacillus sp. GCM10027626]|uniref:S-layer homology domain-containing protein n=1 Tax=Paenibacillus sp. GCM10027626 TaxID=3273411 RepID=UPI00363CAF50